VPLRGELQLWVDSDGGGAAGLLVDGVDVGDDAAVEAFVVSPGRAGRSPSPRLARRHRSSALFEVRS